MRDLIAGWVPPTEDQLKERWSEGLFAVDANILLNLYRTRGEVREELLSALADLGDRLWVPHQAAVDYHRNRMNVLLEQRTAKDRLGSALDAVSNDARQNLETLLQGMSRKEFEPVGKAFDEGFGTLRDAVLDVEEKHREGLGDSIRDDPLLERVHELCEGKVGEPFEPERLREVHAEAQRRIDDHQPPGYADAEKPAPRRYSDFVIWEQICDKAKESDKPLILITDDLKEDWVWRESGQMIGPRAELVAEMNEKCGVAFHLYSSAQFMAQSKGEETDEEVESDADSTSLAERFGGGASGMASPGLGPTAPTGAIGASGAMIPTGLPGTSRGVRRARAAPPIPMHRRTPEGVLVGLNRPPSGLYTNVRCAVIDPSGSATAILLSPPVAGFPMSTLGNPAIRAVYPRDFPGVDSLIVGLHQVIWYRVNNAEFVQMGGGGEREIARDSFVIPQPAQEDAGTDPDIDDSMD